MSKKNWPSFKESMKFSYDYVNLKQDENRWGVLENRYEYIRSLPSTEPKIPKILHQIWLGGEMPELEKQLTKKVQETLTADWKYILWTDNDIYKLKVFKNINEYLSTPNFGQRSDILRYAILNEYGGVYIDTDFLLINQFDDLLDLDFFCGAAYDSTPTVFNGLIGCTPNHPIINATLVHDRTIVYDDAMKLMDATGPFFLERKIFENIEKCERAVVLPNSFFYPLPNFERSKSLGSDYNSYLCKESICCHMWSSSWM